MSLSFLAKSFWKTTAYGLVVFCTGTSKSSAQPKSILATSTSHSHTKYVTLRKNDAFYVEESGGTEYVSYPNRMQHIDSVVEESEDEALPEHHQVNTNHYAVWVSADILNSRGCYGDEIVLWCFEGWRLGVCKPNVLYVFLKPYTKSVLRPWGVKPQIVEQCRVSHKSLPIHLQQWCSNFLARGPHLSFRNSSRATRINDLNKNSLQNYLKWLKC